MVKPMLLAVVRFYGNVMAAGVCGILACFLVAQRFSFSLLFFCREAGAVIFAVLACHLLRNLYRAYLELYKQQLAWGEAKLEVITLGLDGKTQKSGETTDRDAE
jgi:hypothetical protein